MVAASMPPCQLCLISIWGSLWSREPTSKILTSTAMTRAEFVTDPVSLLGSCWPQGLFQGWAHDLNHSYHSESLDSCLKYWDKRGQFCHLLSMRKHLSWELLIANLVITK